MKLNDQVEWTSQAGGCTRTKRGVIVAVVEPNEDPTRVLPRGRLNNPGMPRDHQSYLVQVGKSLTLYWPRVSSLKHVGAPEYESKIYDILRDYEDGTVAVDSGVFVAVGALSGAGSEVYRRIIAAVRSEARP